MAIAKYAGNIRQTGITTREIMKTVKIGDKFHYITLTLLKKVLAREQKR